MERRPEEKAQPEAPGNEDRESRQPYEKPRVQDYRPLEEAGQVYIYYYSIIL
jgi:hypothetical protein